MAHPEVWLTLSEATDRFNVSRTTLRRRLDDGAIEGARQADDGHGSWLVPFGWLSGQYSARDTDDIVLDTPRVAQDALDAFSAERHARELAEAQYRAGLEAIEIERDRLAVELRRERSDLEAVRAELDRSHVEAAEDRRRLEEARELVDVERERVERALIDIGVERARADAAEAIAGERAQQIEATRSREAAAAAEVERLRVELAEAQANGRWSYRRRLRRGER